MRTKRVRVLIVGAGQVGVVIAHHLRQGGAEVSLFVKEQHAAKTKQGFALYPLRLGRRRPKVQRLDAVPVFSDWGLAAEHPWDWVVLAIPPPALREPGFVEGLARVAIGRTQVLALMLGLGDVEWLEQGLGAGHLCRGGIPMISFAVPLGWMNPPEPGTAYFFPPGAAMVLSGGDPAALGEWVDVAVRGGMPACVDEKPGSRLPDAVLFALVSALELVGWQFAGLRGGKELRLSLGAAREREAILEALGAGPSPRLLKLLSPTLIRILLWAIGAILPLPLEDFLRTHFRKVNLQFEQERDRLISSGAARGLATARLARLDDRLRRPRVQPEATRA